MRLCQSCQSIYVPRQPVIEESRQVQEGKSLRLFDGIAFGPQSVEPAVGFQQFRDRQYGKATDVLAQGRLRRSQPFVVHLRHCLIDLRMKLWHTEHCVKTSYSIVGVSQR